ncbi:MAG TPA: PAS domain S-box protein, partial [Bacillota bacterium]|nr:PAS domain S-box protein [Bacillota bacterium]
MLHFEEALNRLAATIAVNDDIMVILERMTGIIGDTMEIDRCLIYELDTEKEKATGLYGWLNPQCPGVAPVLGVIDLEGFPGKEKMLEEREWWESHEDQIHPILLQDDSYDIFHIKLGIKSLLWFPFGFTDTKCYLLCINQSRYRRVWNGVELEFLGSASRLVEVAVQKILLLAEQKKAERAMWEQKERAQITLSSITDGVITTDPEGKVEFINKAAGILTGWKSAEAIGQSISQVLDLEEDKEHRNFPSTSVTDGEGSNPVENKILISRDGRTSAVETTSAPLASLDGTPLGRVHVFRDVTEKRAMLKQLMHQAYHDFLTNLP